MNRNKLIEDLSAFIRLSLRTGFQSLETIEVEAIDIFGDEYGGDDLARHVTALIWELSAELEAEQLSWPAVTDCDRLDAAFEELNAMGIMARHHWTCCSNCARAEMPAEFERIGGEWQGVPIIGYAYYHQQDTEAAVEGQGIHLGYGSTEQAPSEQAYEAKCLKIAKTVGEVLISHALKVTWNGTYETKPHVTVRWQRRSRPIRFCGDDGFGGSNC